MPKDRYHEVCTAREAQLQSRINELEGGIAEIANASTFQLDLADCQAIARKLLKI